LAKITISELALLRLLQKQIPKASASHARTLMCILGKKESYQTIEEIAKSTLLENRALEKIMKALEQNRLVQKEGCLYRKPNEEKIVEII